MKNRILKSPFLIKKQLHRLHVIDQEKTVIDENREKSEKIIRLQTDKSVIDQSITLFFNRLQKNL